MEELPSATLLDETLAAARSSNKVVAVRFGRTADALVRRGDAILREASTTLVKANLLLTFTVNLDEVPEFKDKNTTTEFLTRYIFDKLAAAARADRLGRPGSELHAIRVTLHESHVARAWYEADI